MLQALIFDLNGVLIKSELLSSRFEREFGVMSSEFMPVLKEVMSQVRKPSAPSAYSLWKPYLSTWNLSLSEQEFFDFWFAGESVDKNVLAYVQEMYEKGMQVFILSNNFRERTMYYREHFPQLFTHVTRAYFSWETGHVKPSVGSLQQVLDESGLLPERVVFFDDSKDNVAIAEGLGVRASIWTDLKSAREFVDAIR